MNSDTPKVLVLGLDGGTWTILDDMIRRGIMPNLRAFVDRGLRADLTSTVPPMTPPAWASFQTGKHPGKHSVIDFNHYRPGSRRVPPVDRRMIDGKSLWGLISEWGGTVGIINVPLTYPPERVNGFLVSGFDSPRGNAPICYPPDLMDVLRASRYATSYDYKSFRRDGVEGMSRELIRAMNSQAAVAQQLMAVRHWDLFMYQFQFVDHLQHLAWHVMDSKDPRHASCENSEKMAVDNFYSEVDRHVGVLTRGAGAETDVIIMSDHGFGPLFRTFNLNQWLVKRGDLYPNRALPFWFVLNKAIRTCNRLMKNLGFSKRIEQVLRKGPETLIRGIDFHRSRMFAVPTGVPFTGIYVVRKNVRDYDTFTRELEKDLLSLADPATKTSLVKRIYRRDEAFHGHHQEEMPDLMIEMTDGYEVDTTTTLKSSPDFKDGRNTGIHRMNGIVGMSGPHVRREGTLEGANITDIAPTILDLLGFPIPQDMDGKSLRQAIVPGPKRSIAESGGSCLKEAGESQPRHDDEEIAEQLRVLGYID